MSSNSLTQLLHRFIKFKKLWSLSLRGIQPREFPQLASLEIVDLAQNRLALFPQVPAGITSICRDLNVIQIIEHGFVRVTRLCLNMNRIHHISAELCFPQLDSLEISRNQLQVLSNLSEVCANSASARCVLESSHFIPDSSTFNFAGDLKRK
jgi:hypothetical protein